LYLIFRNLVGRGSNYKSRKTEGCSRWIPKQHGKASREAIIISSGNVGSVLSDGDGEITTTGDKETSSTDKEDSSEFRGSMTPDSSWFSLTSTFQLRGCYTFLINAFTLMVDNSKDWEHSLHCNSTNHRKRFCIWSLQLNEVRISIRAQIEAFTSLTWHLSWEFKSFSLSFSFNTLSNVIRFTEIFKNILKGT
jgi:hypothetical protein